MFRKVYIEIKYDNYLMCYVLNSALFAVTFLRTEPVIQTYFRSLT